MNLTDQEFENMVDEAWNKIPEHFKTEMENVDIRIEMRPTPDQLQRVKAPGTLLGLFEGFAKGAWGQATMGTQPSKISLFQEPLLHSAQTLEALQNLIQEVLMHEVGHYFGYNDDDMFILDQKLRTRLHNHKGQ